VIQLNDDVSSMFEKLSGMLNGKEMPKDMRKYFAKSNF